MRIVANEALYCRGMIARTLLPIWKCLAFRPLEITMPTDFGQNKPTYTIYTKCPFPLNCVQFSRPIRLGCRHAVDPRILSALRLLNDLFLKPNIS